MKTSSFSSVLFVLSLPYRAFARIEQTDLAGGLKHGTEFSDLQAVTDNEPAAILSQVTIRGGSRVDGLTIGYAWNGIPAITHGGTGGTAHTLSLDYGEYITSVQACADKYSPNIITSSRTRIFYLSVTTTDGNSVSGGKRSGSCTTWTAPSGMGLVGWEGRAGHELDAIAPIWGTPSEYI